ncbi:hypothetical protein [Treponema sp. R6D11]
MQDNNKIPYDSELTKIAPSAPKKISLYVLISMIVVIIISAIFFIKAWLTPWEPGGGGTRRVMVSMLCGAFAIGISIVCIVDILFKTISKK